MGVVSSLILLLQSLEASKVSSEIDTEELVIPLTKELADVRDRIL